MTSVYVTFTFKGSKHRADLIEGHDIDTDYFNDANRAPVTFQDNPSEHQLFSVSVLSKKEQATGSALLTL